MRFLLDGMLGELARWLRMLGHDAVYESDMDDKELIARALSEGRILLTADVALYRLAVASKAHAYLVKGKDTPEKLGRLANKFAINLDIDASETRCPVCGSLLAEVQKEQVAGRVPPSTFEAFDEFWACTNAACGKLYWQGAHWKNIKKVLRDARRFKGVGRVRADP